MVDAADFRPEDYTGREVVYVRVPEDDDSIGKEVNFFGVKLRVSVERNPAIIGVLGGGMLGWELMTTRMSLANMIMSDDTFAKEFRDGAFMDMRQQHLDAYTRYATREPKLSEIIPDTINSYKLNFKLGDEVKGRGVSVAEALKELRFTHKLRLLGAGAAAAWSGWAMATGKFDHKASMPENALPEPTISARDAERIAASKSQENSEDPARLLFNR